MRGAPKLRDMTTYQLGGCPACHSQQQRPIADREQIKHELEALWQFHLRRLATGAPVDQLFDRAIFSQQPPLNVVACRNCGTVYRNPREREYELIETYADEVPSAEAFDSLFAFQQDFYRPRAQRLSHLLGRSGAVLEVGSYIGAFLTAAREHGWQGTGLDVNAHASAYAREHGCTIVETTLAEYQPGTCYDAVALWNCFDQLPDPHATLAQVRTLLRPGGVVAIRIPNGAFYARVRRWSAPLARALLAWNNLATFPYRYGFTAVALRRMLEHHDFDVVITEGDVLVPISGPWTRSWARREERLIKAVLRRATRAAHAPWLEVYARTHL